MWASTATTSRADTYGFAADFWKKHCIPQADRVVRSYEPTFCKTGLLTKQQPLPE